MRHEHKLDRFVRKHVPREPPDFSSHTKGGDTGRCLAYSRGSGDGRVKSGRSDVNTTTYSHNNRGFRETLREGQYSQYKACIGVHSTKLDLQTLDSYLNQTRAACVFRHPDLLPFIRGIVDRLALERSRWQQVVDGFNH